MNYKKYGIGERVLKKYWDTRTNSWLSTTNMYTNGVGEIVYILAGEIETEIPDGEVLEIRSVGTKDKNGREAYEGDIYNCGHEYNNGRHKYGDNLVIENIRQFFPEDEFEIIGNIFENEDLLTQNK